MKNICLLFAIIILFVLSSCKKEISINTTKDTTIIYPPVYNSLRNILIDSSYNVPAGEEFALASYLPSSTKIKIVLKPTPGYTIQGHAVGMGSIIGYTMDNSTDSMVFYGIGNNNISTAKMIFGAWIPTSTDIYIYENSASIPTRKHTITTN